jgi:uncharacterized protein (DUF983 family)
MAMGEEMEQRGGAGLRAVDTVILVVVGVIGVVVAFWVLGAVVGLLWDVLKIVVLIGLIAGVLYFLLGRRR